MAHSEAFIADTLAVYHALGGNALRTAQMQGVSDSTVRRWAAKASKNAKRNKAIAEKSEQKKDALAVLWENLAQRALGSITLAKLERAGAKDLATVAGIATEKKRLVSGESTQITETFSRDATIDHLRQRLDRIRSSSPAPEHS